MYPRAAPVVRRTLFLLRRAVPRSHARTHTQPKRMSLGEGMEVHGKIGGIGAPGVPISTRASSGRLTAGYDDDLVNGDDLLLFDATLTDGRTVCFPLLPLLRPLLVSTHHRHTPREYFGAAFTRGRARARTHARGIDTRSRAGSPALGLGAYFSRVARRGRSAAASAIARGRERRRISIPPFPARW